MAEFVKEAKETALPVWSETPGVAPGTWISFTVHIDHYTFNIHSLPGGFSYDPRLLPLIVEHRGVDVVVVDAYDGRSLEGDVAVGI